VSIYKNIKSIKEEIEKISNKKSSSVCPSCGIKISLNKPFCSKSCKAIYFDYIKITLPDIFCRRLATRLTASQRDEELVRFAKKHKYNLYNVIKKYNIYIENSTYGNDFKATRVEKTETK
jgi:hypothetical protein